jgi:GMP synthase-like glutamine amidotransferase
MKFAIVHAEDAEKWRDSARLYIDLLKRDGDEFVVFSTALDGTVPTLADDFDCVVISGSHYNTDSEPAWITELAAYLRAVAGRAKPRVVGICFGAQLIGAALGGRVVHQPFFEFGVRRVKVDASVLAAVSGKGREDEYMHAEGGGDKEANSSGGSNSNGRGNGYGEVEGSRGLAFLRPLVEACTADTAEGGAAGVRPLLLLESHGDAVIELPGAAAASAGASAEADTASAASAPVARSVRIAFSDRCPNEMFLVQGNMLGIQSHPEFEIDTCMRVKLLPYLRGKRFTEAEADEADAAMERAAAATGSRALDSSKVVAMMQLFLRGE